VTDDHNAARVRNKSWIARQAGGSTFELFIVFTADRHLRFLGLHMSIQMLPGGQNALECSEMHCLQCILPTRHQLNAHVRLLETKMAIGRENDE
jgi:hypothetical protein